MGDPLSGIEFRDPALDLREEDRPPAPLTSRAAPLDQFYLPTRGPNALPGGLPAHAFARPDAERELEMAREVIAVVTRCVRRRDGSGGRSHGTHAPTAPPSAVVSIGRH